MAIESPLQEGVRPHIAGGRIVVVAIVCWCLGWVLGLGSLLATGALAGLLSIVARILLWGSFGCVLVAILVRLVAALRNDPDE